MAKTMVAMNPNICEEKKMGNKQREGFVRRTVKLVRCEYRLYPGSLGGAVHIFGHCDYGDDEIDNGCGQASHEIL